MAARLPAILSSLLLGACSVVGIRSGTEEPRFEVVDRVGEVEIRRYAPRIAAETTVPGEEDAARTEGFRRLAGYIFGGNARRDRIAMTAPVAQARGERIAMTAPVAQAGDAGGWRIRFFMPAGYSMDTLPVPDDARVTLVEVPARPWPCCASPASRAPRRWRAARLLSMLRLHHRPGPRAAMSRPGSTTRPGPCRRYGGTRWSRRWRAGERRAGGAQAQTAPSQFVLGSTAFARYATLQADASTLPACIACHSSIFTHSHHLVRTRSAPSSRVSGRRRVRRPPPRARSGSVRSAAARHRCAARRAPPPPWRIRRGSGRYRAR